MFMKIITPLILSLLCSMSYAVSGLSSLPMVDGSNYASTLNSRSYGSGSGSFLEFAYTTNAGDSPLFASHGLLGNNTEKPDLVGGEITYGMGSQSSALLFTLGLSYASVDTASSYQIVPAPGSGYGDGETEVGAGRLMLGYRYTHSFGSTFSIYAGAHAGIGALGVAADNVFVSDVKVRDDNEYDYGFCYAFEAGVYLNLSSSVYLFASYQLYYCDAKPELRTASGGHISVNEQDFQTYRFGIGFTF